MKFEELRFFRVPYVAGEENAFDIFVIHEDGIGVLNELNYTVTLGDLDTLKRVIPNVEILWSTGKLEKHPRIEFLDQTGPFVLAFHCGGSSAEMAQSEFAIMCENEAEALRKEILLNKLIPPDLDYLFVRHKITPDMTDKELVKFVTKHFEDR